MAKKKADDDCWKRGDGKDCGPGEKPPVFDPLDKGKFRFSIWYLLGVLVVLFLVNHFLSAPAGEMIEYSVFKEKIRSGEIKRVEMGETLYRGLTVSRRELEALQQGEDGGGS